VPTIASLLPALDQPIEDRLVITCTGRLVMLPDPDAGRELASPDDIRIEVLARGSSAQGTSGSRVRFEDAQQGLVGNCDSLRYHTVPRQLDLRGSEAAPVQVRTDRFSVNTPGLRVVAGGGDGFLEGPGRLSIRDTPARACASEPLRLASATQAGAVPDAILLAISAALASSASTPSQTSSQTPSQTPGQTPGQAPGQAPLASGPAVAGEPRIPLEILWEDGVDLTFAAPAASEENGALRLASFRGDVRVVGEDFAMRSDRLAVGFTGGGGEAQTLSSIDAMGLVQVRRLGESASMDADELSMTLERVEGRSSPKSLAARGGVAARDAARTILAERLDVTFKPKPQPQPQAQDQIQPAGEVTASSGAAMPPGAALAGNSGPGTPTALGEGIGTVDIATVLATRDVRVELEDGARVYADRLEGDSLAGKLLLQADTGGDVLIVRDKVVADRMKEIRFDDAARTATSEGPGRFRFFEAPVALPELRLPQRPAVGQRPSMEATWTERFTYDDRGGMRREGSITLDGDVNVRSEPLASGGAGRELDTLTARSLVLGLVAAAGSGSVGGGEATTAGSATGRFGAPGEGTGGGRDLATIRAAGSAELQARRWADSARSGLPQQLFRVRGEELEYDLITREARVPTGGDLLVHDVTPGGPELEGATSTFGSRGTSNFAWKGRMEMKREFGNRYVIALADDVEVLHGGLRKEDELALTCDRLEVTVDRPDPQAGGAPPQPDATGQLPRRDPTGRLDIGGDAKLVRIRGIGGVLVQTKSDAEQVSCHEFDYNVATGIATMRARPGEQVQAMVRGGFAPLRAAAMRWDLREGRIQILGAASEVGR